MINLIIDRAGLPHAWSAGSGRQLYLRFPTSGDRTRLPSAKLTGELAPEVAACVQSVSSYWVASSNNLRHIMCQGNAYLELVTLEVLWFVMHSATSFEIAQALAARPH